MALPDLAIPADLSDRGVDTADASLVSAMLAVASSVVRNATQSPILSTTSTVTLWATDSDHYLALPGQPVTAISAVTLDGTLLPVTDYKNVHGRLWRPSGWAGGCEPLEVRVTLTHGFAVVPEHIKQLVCDLAILGMSTASAGAHNPAVLTESIDDYSVTFSPAGALLASAMELPAATKMALRKQFGGGAAMVLSR